MAVTCVAVFTGTAIEVVVAATTTAAAVLFSLSFVFSTAAETNLDSRALTSITRGALLSLE